MYLFSFGSILWASFVWNSWEWCWFMVYGSWALYIAILPMNDTTIGRRRSLVIFLTDGAFFFMLLEFSFWNWLITNVTQSYMSRTMEGVHLITLTWNVTFTEKRPKIAALNIEFSIWIPRKTPYIDTIILNKWKLTNFYTFRTLHPPCYSLINFLKSKYVTDNYFLEFPTKTFWFCVMK